MHTLEESHFYSILDTAYVPRSKWIPTYRALIDGGADLVQIRAKNAPHEERIQLLECLLPDFALSGKPLIINDDIEAAGCYPGMNLGLHLGQEDTSPEDARERLGPSPIIGLSTHSEAQARQAIRLAEEKIINYFAVGPLFQTPTKPDYQPVGLELAQKVQSWNPPVPFFVIGGITRETLPLVAQAGLKRIVVVSEVLKANSPQSIIQEMKTSLPLPLTDSPQPRNPPFSH